MERLSDKKWLPSNFWKRLVRTCHAIFFYFMIFSSEYTSFRFLPKFQSFLIEEQWVWFQIYSFRTKPDAPSWLLLSLNRKPLHHLVLYLMTDRLINEVVIWSSVGAKQGQVRHVWRERNFVSSPSMRSRKVALTAQNVSVVGWTERKYF